MMVRAESRIVCPVSAVWPGRLPAMRWSTPWLPRMRSSACDVGEPRHVRQLERLVGEEARDHQRQGGVLRPRDRDRAVERRPAGDANAVHCFPSSLCADRSAGQLRRSLVRAWRRPRPPRRAEARARRRPPRRGLPSRPRACALRRLRFSRNAAFSRSGRFSAIARPSRPIVAARHRPFAPAAQPG